MAPFSIFLLIVTGGLCGNEFRGEGKDWGRKGKERVVLTDGEGRGWGWGEEGKEESKEIRND